MRRLEFAPAPKDMEVTDIENGRFVFRPRPDKPVSLAGHVAFVIRSSDRFPKRSSVAVEHRGGWLYVDNTDLTSKAIFVAVQSIF